MNIFNKLIRIKYFEIFMSILFLFVGTLIWNSWRHSDAYKLMKEPLPSSFAYVEVLSDSNYEIFPMNDELAISNLAPYSVQLVNSTYLDSTYSFGIRVSKESTLDYHILKFSFQDQVGFLKDFYKSEDDEYYYFVFEEGNLTAAKISYDIKFWIDNESRDDFYGKTFQYEFINLDMSL